MQQRRDEILAKKAKLAELKRQRELRASQATASRQSTGSPGDLVSPIPGRAENRRDIETLINSLVGESRPGSTNGGAASPARRGSRPNSVLSAGELSTATSEFATTANGQPTPAPVAVAPPVQLSLTTAPLTTIYECPPSPVKEVHSYSKGVQTAEAWTSPTRPRAQSLSDNEDIPPITSTPSKRLSRRQRDREEELRQDIRKEVEEELKASLDLLKDGVIPNDASNKNYPMRKLTAEELEAVTGAPDFADFLEKSTKVIERALDQEYDILTDYALQGQDVDDEDDESGNFGGKGRRRVKEVAQFFDERWSKKRMISSIDFSHHHSELMLASYTKNPTAPHEPDGLVQWPGPTVGYESKISTCAEDASFFTGYGHTHPIYSVDIVGTQNANNIISTSTDGVVCGWSMDVFAQPQELLELKAPPGYKLDDVSPTCLAFPQTDPTFFLVGSEEGTIFPCHRYDRAGAKAGVDARVSYKGHTAPV
ncbi:cytoplasmic dynein 1 intermediate chain 1, partial [Colletotrichum higginsianum]